MHQVRGSRKGQRYSMTHASRETRFAAVKAALRVSETRLNISKWVIMFLWLSAHLLQQASASHLKYLRAVWEEGNHTISAGGV